MHLLILINGTTPTTDDSALLSHLDGQGHTYETRPDDQAIVNQANDEATFDAILLIDGTSSSFNTTYRTYTIPMLVSASFLWDESLFVTSGTAVVDGTDITIQDDTHPIALDAGLTAGTYTITTALAVLNGVDDGVWGNGSGNSTTAPPGFTWIAHRSTNIASKSFVAIEEGSVDTLGGTYPARRIAFPIQRSYSLLNSMGWDLFDACLAWIAPPAPPTIESYIADPSEIFSGEEASLIAEAYPGTVGNTIEYLHEIISGGATLLNVNSNIATLVGAKPNDPATHVARVTITERNSSNEVVGTTQETVEVFERAYVNPFNTGVYIVQSNTMIPVSLYRGHELIGTV